MQNTHKMCAIIHKTYARVDRVNIFSKESIGVAEGDLVVAFFAKYVDSVHKCVHFVYDSMHFMCILHILRTISLYCISLYILLYCGLIHSFSSMKTIVKFPREMYVENVDCIYLAVSSFHFPLCFSVTYPMREFIIT